MISAVRRLEFSCHVLPFLCVEISCSEYTTKIIVPTLQVI